mmetsp:Transcript_25298/g.55051  ORF Transcript_25298/g.55051 Transcript_25298/m.55051 type:complete len:207 (+) Transcript_25298:939-1559(+)
MRVQGMCHHRSVGRTAVGLLQRDGGGSCGSRSRKRLGPSGGQGAVPVFRRWGPSSSGQEWRRANALHNNLALALQLQGANVTEAMILEQFVQPRVSQRGLAELQIKARAEETLDVRERDDSRLPMNGGVVQDFPQAHASLLPGCQGHVGDCLLGKVDRLLPDSILLLNVIDRLSERDHVSLQIAQDSFLRNSELHNVADFAERAAF